MHLNMHKKKKKTFKTCKNKIIIFINIKYIIWHKTGRHLTFIELKILKNIIYIFSICEVKYKINKCFIMHVKLLH